MDEYQENIEPKMEMATINKKNKLAEAEALIEASKDLVAKVDSDIAECKVGISQAAEDFDEAKRKFKNGIFEDAENLLERVGFEYINFEEREAFELSIDGNDEENFSVESLSSGRFMGFLLAIVVALLTVVAWLYLAISKLDIDINNMSMDRAVSHVEPILKWIGGEIISANGNIVVGAFILGFSALIMAWLVYALLINLKGAKNLRIAQETFAQSKEYCMTQEECQKEMKRVDKHLREATAQIGNFETILNEQSATLKRILHVEGAYDEGKEYHPSSKKVMRETEKIMRAAEDLLETAITKDKKLNFQSVQALNAAADIYAEYLARIYD